MNAARYISTSAFGAASLPDVFERCAEEGFDGIELSGNVTLENGWREALRATRGSGTRILLHNYFPPPHEPFVLNLASDQPQTRERSLEHCREALRLSAEVGAPFFSVHAGFAARLKPSDLGRPFASSEPIPLDLALRLFDEAVTELCDLAAELGLRLLVENNVVAAFNLVSGRNDLLLLATPKEMQAFCERVAHPALGLLIDVGHLNVSANVLGFDRTAWVDTLAGWVGAFHLSENDGTRDDNRPFDASAWFLPLLSAVPHAARVVEVSDAGAGQRRSCWESLN